MKNRITPVLFVLCLICALLFTACNADTVGDHGTASTDTQRNAVTDTADTTPAMTAAEMASHLAEVCAFSETLSENNAYLENHLFGFGALVAEMESYSAFVPAGITPEEVFVFVCKDAASVDRAVLRLGEYVAYQISEYGDYAEQEVPKLDEPVIRAEGNVVVYVVSEDNAAAADLVSAMFRSES